MTTSSTRRRFVHSAIFGFLAVSANAKSGFNHPPQDTSELFYRYPAIADEFVSAVVGAAHSNLDRVKELVNERPELAKASWDWGFGDIESALGAASHMGRRDIAEFLMSRGARADIFTFAMLGQLDVVKAMVAAAPGIQQKLGPHGITLLEHAQSRLRHSDLSAAERKQGEAMVAYLESLGDAHLPDVNLPITAEEQAQFIGDYRWGEGEDELFYVSLNRRKLLQIGRKGTFGRALNRISENVFTPDGASSVRIDFVLDNGRATSVSVVEHNYILNARRV